MFRNSLGIYEKALAPQPWPELFDTAARLGFDFVEISLDDSERRMARLEWSAAEWRQMANTAREAGLQLFGACLSGHKRYALGSTDEQTRKKSLDMLQKATAFCAEAGIRNLQLAGCDVFYEPSTEETKKRFYENLGYGLRWAESYGVMYSIEPLEHACFYNVSTCMEAVDYFHSPWLNVYPDVANMAGMGVDPIPEIENGLEHCIAVHLREAQPDFFMNVPFGTGIVDFDGVFRMLAEHGWKRPFVIEMWNETDPDYFALVSREKQFIEEKMHKYQLR